MIYMDNAATTRMKPEVARAMAPYMGYKYANPSGIYTFSSGVKKEINSARSQLAMSINADEKEIYITSGGTESDNWALKMAADEHKRGHIITSTIEHHAILKSCAYLSERGTRITYAGVDADGVIRLDELERAIRPDTFLISVMTGNNEVGTIQPIEQIAKLAKRYNILFHTDAVQAYTNIPIDVKAMDIDMLSTSAHKINGPKGIGFLYIKDGVLKTPFINGGGQESGMRAGTENVAGIMGFAEASRIAVSTMKQRTSYEIRMRDYLIERVLKEIPDSRLNGHRINRLANNCNFSFKSVDGASLIVMLDQQGICASAGSACSSGSKSGSHVLKAMGLTDELVHSAVRLTLNEEISRREVDYVVKCLAQDIEELRSL